MKLNPRRFGCALIVLRRLPFQVLVTAIGLSLASATQAQHYPSPTDWRNENIYQILTDRFYDGNPSNDNVEASRGSPYNPTYNAGIHGGDFQGIQDKLDYIKALGATAIWISPIPLNIGDGSSAYHGYAAQDFYTLAPHWGTMTDLSNMVQAAHARGIKVILDIVCNHMGNLLTSTDPNWPNWEAPPAGYNLQYIDPSNQHAFPFNPTNVIPPSLSTIFHTNGDIGDFSYPSATQEVVLGQLDGLNDLATETTYVRTNLMNIYTNWVGLADFDGFRVDTAIEVDYGFWQYWCGQLHQSGTSIGKSNFFMFGEAFSGSEQQVGSYTGTEDGGPFMFDAMLDYPLYFTINPVFAQAYANTSQISDHYNNFPVYYDSNSWYRMVTFLDNHDNARFLSSGNANGNTNNLTVALQFLYSSRGIPCLYYGTEQAFAGDGNNNDNREDMFGGQFQPQIPVLGDNFNETQPLFQQIARLNNFRRLYPALRTGVQNDLFSDPNGPGLFAYSRVLSNQEVFVCFNTASSSEVLSNCPTTYAPGTVLVDLLNTNDTVVVATASGTNATPLITVPAMTAKIYISESLVLPLDPVVVGQSPTHAATCVPGSAPIVLQFSKPMNTNSVKAAFSITPATTGTFAWNTTHDTMTFTPSAAWPIFTTNLVHLSTNAVDSVSGNTFYSPFDTFFVTYTTNTVTTSPSPAIGGTTSGGGMVSCGSNVTVCATPNPCYSFLYWSQGADLVSTSACYTSSVTGNEAVVANFVNGQGSLAIDNAADPTYANGGWINGADGGSGFSPWALLETATDGSCNGFFVSTSIASSPHAIPGIDVNGVSWGLYANSEYCGEPTIAAAYRGFATGSLQSGGQVLLDMDNGLNDNLGSTVGFALRNGDATNYPTDYATGARLQFYLGGGDADYTVVDAAGARDTGVSLTYSGLHLIFTLGANDTYTLTIIGYGTGTTNTITGTLGGTPNSTLDSIALFNNDNGTDPPHDVFFNSLLVANFVPFVYAISTSSLPASAGTTSGGGTVNCGSNVTVCATPNWCYQFVNWTVNGNAVGASTCLVFQASSSQTLVANFTNSATDSVGDGIPDCWRQRYFGGNGKTTNALSCATCDVDGTGQNNLFKYVAGLDPTNPASVFVLRIQNVPNRPTHKNLIYRPIANGCTYVIDSTTDLVAGAWTPQPVSAPVTNGVQVTVTDPNATSGQKFYRVNIYNVITNIVIQDSVGDGIPDSWRAQYFPGVDPTGETTNDLSCATCDADGTGQDNLFKYVSGLDPTNAHSVFVLTIDSVTNQPPQNNLFFSPLALGRTYLPQFSTNLRSGIWLPLTSYTGPLTNGSRVSVIDTNPIPPQEFYRMEISLP
jgi:glycosidase